MNIIIPMAHLVENFDSSEYMYPKPLVELHGKPLIEYVIENLMQIDDVQKVYFILKDSICAKFHLDNTIQLLCPKAEIVYLKNNTSGSVCSVLMAIDQIKHNEECIIVNADQIFLGSLNKALDNFRKNKLDGAVITFPSVHPRWSYALTDGNQVVQFAEKNPISKNAIAGFYYFKQFNLFVEHACKTIMDDDSLNGIYYTSSVLNQLILSGKKVSHVAFASNEYLSLYSIQKIKEFETYLNKHNL
jgi:NDP-sugar pyrophosphorylase family protein